MADAPLKVFTDREYLPEGLGHCMMLKPFWGGTSDHDGYDRLVRTGPEFLRLAPAEGAEVALLPFDGSHLIHDGKQGRPDPRLIAIAARFAERASAAGLPTVVIVNSDSTRPIPIADAIVFRTSLDRRRRGDREFPMPAWHEDLVANHLGGEIRLRPREDVPSVGFCGLAADSAPRLRRRVKMLARRAGRPLGLEIEHNDGIYLRREAMLALEASGLVRTEFIVRSQFFGGAVEQPMDAEARARIRSDFVSNLVDNDYALSARGYGNFSFRFFEAMSVGRIPLLIDTDCVLPYEFLHDYRSLCVIVPEDEIRGIGRAVAGFHGRFSAGEYLDLQRRIREFWVEWLSPEGFFRHLPLHWRPRPAIG